MGLATDLALALDPSWLLVADGMTPDKWQDDLLRSTAKRVLLVTSRQVGKSSCTAALVLSRSWARPDSLSLVIAPSQRQAAEMILKIRHLLVHLPMMGQVIQESALALRLANGSRIVALPALEGTVRGYSGVDLLVIDEAAWVPDQLYYAVRPMLASSNGALIALSTPNGKRGWLYREWISPDPEGVQGWERTRVLATECPRITPEFLAEERLRLPYAAYRQEYFCEFTDAEGAVFAAEDIEAAVVHDPAPSGLRFPMMA